MHSLIGPWLVSLRQCAYLCLLLSSPERLPHHPQAIVLNIVSYLLLGLLLVSDSFSYTQISGQILLQFAMLAMIARTVLGRKNLEARFVQTYSALTGVTLLIDALTIPIHLYLQGQPDVPERVILTIGISILVWNLAVLSLIFKRAFEISTPQSAMLSFAYFVAYHLFVFSLFK